MINAKTINSCKLSISLSLSLMQYGSRHIIEAMEECGHKLEVVFICGGLRRNNLYVNSHANITGEFSSTCTHTCTHVHMPCTCTCTCTHNVTCTHMHAYNVKCIHMYAHALTCTHMFSCILTCSHMLSHAVTWVWPT